jgi:sugar fermentation stimulation protein A
MIYTGVREAVFLERPNRFVAAVELDGRRETVHVKNTGRCRELLLPGARVILAPGAGQGRRTAWDLVTVLKPGLGWVNIDSQAPNRVVREWLDRGAAPFPDLRGIRPEFPFGSSRVDFCLDCGSRRVLLEVKGCTLERDGQGWFPDAPTLRGAKHLRELAAARAEGWDCAVAFVIAMPGVTNVLPNRDTDPAFADALAAAVRAGVHVLHLPCRVGPAELCVM